MKQHVWRIGAALSIAAVLVLTGCPQATSSSGGDTADPTLTGTVTISGTAQVGKTLTATVNGSNGTGTPVYVWQRGDTSTGAFTGIQGATSQTYTLADADLNKYIKVTVSYAGYSGTLTAVTAGQVTTATGGEDPTLTGTVTIGGTVEVGKTLTATVNGSNGTGTPAYVWQQGDTSTGIFTDIQGATSQTYTLVDADLNKYIKVTMSYAGYSGTLTAVTAGQVTTATGGEDPTLTGTVTIGGTVEVGKTLTATVNGSNGTGTPVYVWQRGDTSTGAFTDIQGATSQTYTLADADLNKYIKVTVSYAGYSGTLTAVTAGQVTTATGGEDPTLTGTVTIGGTVEVGKILTATVNGSNGTGTPAYVWQQGDTSTGIFTDIQGATSQTYTLVDADLNKYIKVTVSYTGFTGSVSSVTTGQVTFPALTGTVAISGTAIVGQTLTATVNGSNGTGTPAYVWQRSDTSTGTFTDIANATSGTYLLVDADQNKYIKVTVSYTGFTGNISSVTTGQVTFPALTGTVTIDGTAQVGQTLTATVNGSNGTGTPAYVWQRGDTSTGTFTDIANATSGTYLLVDADQNKYIKVTVSYTGFTGSVSSVTTGQVTFPALTGTVTIDGTAQVGQTLTATVNGSNGTGTPAYVWQQGDTSTGTFTDIAGATSKTYTLAAAGQNKYIKVTVSYAGNSGSITTVTTGSVIAADTIIDARNLTALVTKPLRDAAPDTMDIDETQYAGTIEWKDTNGNDAPANFAPGTIYQAVLTLIAKSGFTFTGVAVDSFTYTGARATNAADSGTVTITFPATSNTTIPIGGNPSVKLYLDNGTTALTDIPSTVGSSGTGTFKVSIASGVYNEIIWYLNETKVAEGSTKTSITLSKQNAGTYIVTVEATTADGSKNTGVHTFIVE